MVLDIVKQRTVVKKVAFKSMQQHGVHPQQIEHILNVYIEVIIHSAYIYNYIYILDMIR